MLADEHSFRLTEFWDANAAVPGNSGPDVLDAQIKLRA